MKRSRFWPPIILFAALMAVSAWSDSAIVNEDSRLASGVYYWKTGDYSLFHVNPPLVSLVGALPSVLSGAESVSRADVGFSRDGRDEYRAGGIFVKKNPRFRFLLFAGRLCCILLLLAGFTASVWFSRAVWGAAAGYWTLGIVLFSPYILGHGHLMTPDAISGMFAVAAVYFFWRWLRAPGTGTAFAAGLALGIAELTKFTLLIFYPLFPVLWLIYRFPKSALKPAVSLPRQLWHFVLIVAVSLLVINMGYFFEGTGKPLRSFTFRTALFTGCGSYKDVPFDGGNRFNGSGTRLETALGYLPMPLPKNFVQGIDTQRLDFEAGMPSYLRGTWSNRGWWYYYLYATLLKNPLGTIGLFLLALFCTFFLRGYNADWRDELVVLLPGIALLAFVSSQTGFSIHSRYVIPALQFFFLWSSKAARAFTPEVKAAGPKSSCAMRWLAAVLLAWSIGSSLWVYPHSIAYFNELAAVLPTPEDRRYPRPESPPPLSARQKVCRFLDAGPLNGPRHLLGSEVDWDQNFYRLLAWYRNHPETHGKITVDGIGNWAGRGLIPQTIPKHSERTEPRWYAVGVNRLYGEDQDYRRFFHFAPEQIIGYTIYVYHVSPEELERAGRCHLQKEAVR